MYRYLIQELSERLRERGLEEAMDEPVICRWRHRDSGLVIDVMPTSEDVLGFSNPWYAVGITTAVNLELPTGKHIRAVAPPVVVATKLAAWLGRGGGDVLASLDVHDIVVLIDGRPALVDELAAQPERLRSYVVAELASLREIDYFEYVVQGAVSAYGQVRANAPQSCLSESTRSSRGFAPSDRPPHYVGHLISSLRRIVVLPNPDHRPAGGLQLCVRVSIPPLIRLDLLPPPDGVLLWPTPVLGATRLSCRAGAATSFSEAPPPRARAKFSGQAWRPCSLRRREGSRRDRTTQFRHPCGQHPENRPAGSSKTGATGLEPATSGVTGDARILHAKTPEESD